MTDAFNGAAAAVIATCITNPADVLKSRLQFQGEVKSRSNQARPYTGVLRSMAAIARKEGVKGMYRGFAPSIVIQAMGNATRFGVFYSKEAFGYVDPRQTPFHVNFAFALLSSVVAGVMVCPLYNVKTRMQITSSNPALAVGHQHHHSNWTAAFSQITSTDGYRGLWTGWQAFMPRVMVSTTTRFSLYDTIKGYLLLAGLPESTTTHALAGGLASGLSVITSHPLDFLSVRMMNQPTHEGKPLYYLTTRACFWASLKEGNPDGKATLSGVANLYKGCGVHFLRMAPHYTITFVLAEYFKQLTSSKSSKSSP